MPCGTDAIDCHNCGKHALTSVYRCKLCRKWFCAECVVRLMALPNLCVACILKAVDSYVLFQE